MTVGLLAMGVRAPRLPPKDETPPSAGASISPTPRHPTSQGSNQRPKFMITDILSRRSDSQNVTPSPLCPPTPAEGPKDLSIVRSLTEDEDEDDIDLDGEGSNDEDETDFASSSKLFSFFSGDANGEVSLESCTAIILCWGGG